MLTFNHFRRRVSVSKKHGALVAHIARHNDRAIALLMLAACTVVFLFFCYPLVPTLLRRPFSRDVLYALPFLAFVLVWYLIALRLSVWRAFGIEEIVVDGGVLYWTRTALWWKRKVEVPIMDITEVKAVTPWHALSNRVEFTARGTRRSIGDMLLRDET